MTLRSLFVDFNSYFASVEQQENPELRGRPVAVVPVIAETTCCIAASNEAKQYGIKTGTLVSKAKQLCPELTIVAARPAVYVKYHDHLMAAIKNCIPTEKPNSIDEVECLLMGREREPDRAMKIAMQIKQSVGEVGEAIKCSIGIAPNGFLAKTASDMQKPDGLVVLELKNLPEALFHLELKDLCGIGPNVEKRLRDSGIHSVEQLCFSSRAKLREIWGSVEGERFHDLLKGDVVIRPHRDGDDPASIGHSHVLAPQLRNTASVNAVLKKLLMKAAMRLREKKSLAGSLQVRVKYLGFESWEVSERIDPTDDSKILLHKMIRLLDQRRDIRKPLSVAVTLTCLVKREGTCAPLFSDMAENPALTRLLDQVNRKYGNNKMYFGGTQQALDAAPMRISFSRVPDVAMEDESDKNDLWLQRLNQFRVLALAEHKEQEGGTENYRKR